MGEIVSVHAETIRSGTREPSCVPSHVPVVSSVPECMAIVVVGTVYKDSRDPNSPNPISFSLKPVFESFRPSFQSSIPFLQTAGRPFLYLTFHFFKRFHPLSRYFKMQFSLATIFLALAGVVAAAPQDPTIAARQNQNRPVPSGTCCVAETNLKQDSCTAANGQAGRCVPGGNNCELACFPTMNSDQVLTHDRWFESELCRSKQPDLQQRHRAWPNPMPR